MCIVLLTKDQTAADDISIHTFHISGKSGFFADKYVSFYEWINIHDMRLPFRRHCKQLHM